MTRGVAAVKWSDQPLKLRTDICHGRSGKHRRTDRRYHGVKWQKTNDPCCVEVKVYRCDALPLNWIEKLMMFDRQRWSTWFLGYYVILKTLHLQLSWRCNTEGVRKLLLIFILLWQSLFYLLQLTYHCRPIVQVTMAFRSINSPLPFGTN